MQTRLPRMTRRALTLAITAIGLVLVGVLPARATPVLLNGGFEAGLANWITLDQLGSEGGFLTQNGTSSPVNGFPVPAPPGGTRAAMTDAMGPGSHVLYQDFLVDSASGALSFALFIGNRADAFFTPNPATVGLNFATPSLNQQARVDILAVGADPFSVAAADVLLNLYQTNPGNPLVSGYTTFTFDLSALFAAQLGQTLRLRFAETDNVNTFNLGVDNVTFTTAEVVPEPATLVLLASGLSLIVARRRRMSRPPSPGGLS